MCIFIKYLESISWAHTRKSLSGFKSELTSSRAGGCGLARLAAAGREVGAGADGLAVASFFLSFLGLSRESSTVASARGEMCSKISIISLVQWSCFTTVTKVYLKVFKEILSSVPCVVIWSTNWSCFCHASTGPFVLVS